MTVSDSHWIVFNNKLIYGRNDASTGYELWQYDDVLLTSTIIDSLPGTDGLVGKEFHEFNGKLYFGGIYVDNTGTSLFGTALVHTYDGSQLSNFQLSVTPSSSGNLVPVGTSTIHSFNGEVYLQSFNDTVGIELFKLTNP